MLESSVEKHLVDECAKRGIRALKLKTPGRRNAPDRMLLIPKGILPTYPDHGTVVFIELKAPGKKPRVGQMREMNRLHDEGFMCHVCDSKPKVDAVLKLILGQKYNIA